MNSFIFALMVIIFWGIWGFFAKLATIRIGWPMVMIWGSSFSLLLTIIFLFSKFSFRLEPTAGILIFLSALFGTLGGISFYKVLSTHPASIIVPLTSLYPAITILLGMLFLRETLTIKQFLGIIFALLAVFLLGF